MKKIILVAAVGMLLMSSCKKTYICQCTTEFSNSNIEDGYSNFFYEGVLEGSTSKKCKEDNEGSVSGAKTTCEIVDF